MNAEFDASEIGATFVNSTFAAGADLGQRSAPSPSAYPLTDFWSSELAGFVVALGVGLLIGVERERRKRESKIGVAGGVRTHAIVALAGALARQFTGIWILAIGAVFVGVLVLLVYARERTEDLGVTSEVTLFATYLLGALAVSEPQLAAGVGVVVALMLALRETLHRFVERTLTDREVLDAMLLAGAALVVLPLMPDEAVDRLGVVNPRVIWELTVLVLSLNGFGYVALRAFGPGRGLPIAGFFGGFVSSAATIGVLGTRAKSSPALFGVAVAGGLLSSVATVIQLGLVLSVVEPGMLQVLLPTLIAMAIVAVVASMLFMRRLDRHQDSAEGHLQGRAFEPGRALVFSVTVTALLWISAFLRDRYGAAGALVGIAFGGFADAHSATASAAALAAKGVLSEGPAAAAVMMAVLTNTATKIVVATVSGGWRYALTLAGPLLAMAAAGSAVAFVTLRVTA